ncbi:aminotransferase-like domain-containing protein [Aeromicrobium massiliense]|uniref:aminotransferase-like domain-containing protein n=1 Tax=Aeromicrobium massiliense TaxID=1464554 RepID=UPI000303A256|nr:PLP-dependent aminotransferase family protein [Aeromicrobium massiliense]
MSNDSSWQGLADVLAEELEHLPAGARIPTHRQLVQRFGASATTVSRALSSLSRQGLIESRPGAGSFRSASRAATSVVDTGWQEAALAVSPVVGSEPTPVREHDASTVGATLSSYGADVVDLNSGYLHPDLQPLDLLATALGRVGRRRDTWERPEVAGLPDLRDWFATEIGAGLARHDVLVTAGGQAALSLVMRAVGTPGDPVVVETPTYPGILAAAAAAGLRAVPVPVDNAGIQPEHLERALTQTGARLVVVQPRFHNPTGVSLSDDRRRQVIELVVRHGAFLVEDDFARYLPHTDAAPPSPSLIEGDPVGAVVHVRSLTKSTSPNLRVAGVAGRGPVMGRLRAAHVVDTMFVPAVLQHAALEVLTSASWPRALRSLAGHLADRRDVAVEAVRQHLPEGSLDRPAHGGYHLWVRTPTGTEDHDVAARALQRGVAVTPGSNYHPTRATTNRLRLSYVAAPSPADVVAGIRRLGEALHPR